MGGVGDLLDAVYSGPDPTPLHAVVHERCDWPTAERVGEAFAREQPPLDIPFVMKLMTIPMIAMSLPSMVAKWLRRNRPEPGEESARDRSPANRFGCGDTGLRPAGDRFV